MKNKRRFTFVSLGFAAVIAMGAASPHPARALDFNLVQNTGVSPDPATGLHGIARVGSEWLVGNFNRGWNVYDLAFNEVATVTTTPEIGATRGIVFHPPSGNVFVCDNTTSRIVECTPTGTVVSSFATGAAILNAVAYNPNTDRLFAVHFNGEVRQFTTSGLLVGSFTTVGQMWTGAAFDSMNETLLLLNSAADQVLEYTPAGVLVDTPLAGDAIADNGQGIHYESSTGLLHVTELRGGIAIWERFTGPISVEDATWSGVKGKYRLVR